LPVMDCPVADKREQMVSEQAPIQLGAWAVRFPAASRLPDLAAPGSVSGRGCCPVNAFPGDAAVRLFIVMDLLLTCSGFECCIGVGRAVGSIWHKGHGPRVCAGRAGRGGVLHACPGFCGFRRPDLDHHPGWDGDNLGLLRCDPPDCVFSGFPGRRPFRRDGLREWLGGLRGADVLPDAADEALAGTSGSGNSGSILVTTSAPAAPDAHWISAGAAIPGCSPRRRSRWPPAGHSTGDVLLRGKEHGSEDAGRNPPA
jgi:hypothetical protein